MNRRGTALLLALLVLMLTGAIATAALSLAQLRWRSGLARRAAAQATLELHSALGRHLAGWRPQFESLPQGRVMEIGRAEADQLWRRDSLRRLSPTLYQVTSVVETGRAEGRPLGRAAAAMLVRVPLPDSARCASTAAAAVVLQALAGVDDGKGSGDSSTASGRGVSGDSRCADTTMVGDTAFSHPGPVSGGWWRMD